MFVRAEAWPTNAKHALISIRPEKVHVSKERIEAENVFSACVEEELFKGSTSHLVLASEAGTRLSVVVANESALVAPIHRGERVFCSLHADDIIVLCSE